MDCFFSGVYSGGLPGTPSRFYIRRVWAHTNFSVYELNYAVPVALTVVSSWMECTPRFDVDYRLVFLIVFLSHPANYLIRWALVRSDSALNEKSASERGQAMAEAAAGDSGGDADEDRLKAGRRIGTLERWVIGCSWRLKISEKCHRCLVVRMDKTKTGTLCPRPTDRRIDNMQNPIPFWYTCLELTPNQPHIILKLASLANLSKGVLRC